MSLHSNRFFLRERTLLPSKAENFKSQVFNVSPAMACKRFVTLGAGFIVLIATLFGLPSASAQTEDKSNEQFIPADQLDAVFDRDRRGVMMKRDEFRALLAQARANAARESIPIAIITEQARLTVTPGDQQALVSMELKVRQYAKGWQTLKIRAGNLLIEKIEIDGKPAVIGRDPEDPTAVVLAHDTVDEFTAVVSMSTQLATLGSDRTAAFQLPVVPAVEMTVRCPAGRHLLVNDLKLERPAADDAAVDYVIPVGNAPDVRLRWVVQRKESEAQTLVFVRTDGQLQVQKETLRWDSDSRLSVFGGTINKVVARVPARLEITSVESTGLEAWTLDDDPDNAGFTRVTLTYRQPFTNDRMIRIRAVAAAGDVAMQKIPTLQFAEVTAHTGRLVVNHESGLRLVSEVGGGIRRMSSVELGLSSEASVFEFWLQEFELQVAAKPRDRELFVESSAVLTIDDTSAMFTASITVETLNAPLFELPLSLPPEWQLTSVEADGNAVPWTTSGDATQILVRPPQAIAPGQLMTLVVKMTRTIADPDVEQKLALPVITAAETTTVGGSYVVRFADDLTVAPLSLTGLTPIAGSGTEQVFQNLGTTVTGELSIVRKPARLAARSVLRSWADLRQQSLDAEIITDVLNGTIRSLTIRLSESLGADVRFEVRSVGPVPGIEQTRAIRPITIVEQSAGEVVDGLRPFTLKLDYRFAGSLSLHAFVQQPRTGVTPIAAPVVQVQDAVRQHGVLVFEASPEQQLSVGQDVRLIPGLFVADAGLVDAPDAATARRVALTYRFVQPGYSFEVNETRFATDAVPSAVCELLANVCTLNDAGGIQRWCSATIRSSGVQTLRFRLPEGDQSFLWSTMLNNEPVEVRRDGGDYLVALPTNSERQENLLTVLFESDSQRSGVFGQTNQQPIQLSIDAGELRAIPIDVLKQTYRVFYPRSSMLVDSDGQFRPTSGVDQPGWLVSLGTIAWPDTSELPQRLIPMAIFLLVLFVLTVIVIRRRWIALAGIAVLLIVSLLLLPATQQTRQAAKRTMSRNFLSDSIRYDSADSRSEAMADFETAAPMAMDDMFGATPTPQAAAGGMAGYAGGGFGGRVNSYAGMPGGYPAAQSGMALPPGDGGADFGLQVQENDISGSIAQPAVPQSAMPQRPMSQSAVPDQDSPTDPFAAPSDVSEGRPALMPSAGQPAKGRRGNARLSVNVNLDVPSDYQVREFVSVADAIHHPSELSLVVQRREQITAIRLVAAMMIILLAWWMRKSSMLWKLTVAITLLLCAVALLPLLSNAWQSVLDGVAIGSLVSIAMAIVCLCRQWCLCGLSRIGKVGAMFKGPAFTRASVLLICGMSLSSVVLAAGQQTTEQDKVSQPDVVVPYAPDQPALRSDRVFIRHDDFLKLYQLANPDAWKVSPASPLGSGVIDSFFKTGEMKQVDEQKHVLSFDGRFVVWSDSDAAVSVALPIGPVAIRSLQVDGKSGFVQPLIVGGQATVIPNFAAQQLPAQQQTILVNSAAATSEGPAYAVEVTGKGAHVVDVKFEISALIEGELGRADFPLRSATSGTLEWTLPADGLDAKVNGRTNVYRREGRTVILPIAQLSTVRLQWLPTIQKVAGDVVYHSMVNSAMSVQDSGIVLRTTVAVTCRQGEISELDITIPEGYSVQSVTGEDVAGWTAQSTDATRALKLQLRRSVNDATKITMQLYAAAPTAEALSSLAVPISIVRGASRDLGTVLLKTGSQFQVRSDSLSAVTQINPSDAPVPDGDALAGRPMLAWRYTRHPASVTVKVTPTADEMNVESMHAVRLEEQRQLWSSRITLRVSGAPRSRIDIAVPRGFQALDVSATGLKDWYFVDVDSDDGDVAKAANTLYKTLSIQLIDAHSGSLEIAAQGQTNRDTDRTLLKLQPPAVLNATKTKSEMAVWLDAASESAGVENGTDWVVKSTVTASAGFREISSTAPSLVFQSNAIRPGDLSIKLRQAVSTLIAETVTVTNVTETAVEIILALNWQIARAAADHFAVELPSAVASVMTFDVPGQRRVTREDLGNGMTRVVLQLQQPVTDRLFVLGNASLPLPADRVIRSDIPGIVVPAAAPSTLSGQSHFWVLVNQSSGLLQPTAEQADDKVSPEQIATQIPQDLLQQAVAVKRLRPETAAWNLVYPEQFQVAPAVVNLATHTTVISDDGSWRSRHQLQVMNESRQFLPVILPKDSRLMYCLVQGRPSRVVIRGEGDGQRHLIPIPQSGALASGFEVEFALTGRFADSAASVRKDWKSQQLTIPVPVFPEFRDDPEFGIQVSRNRWSLYVPESWNATLVEDPNQTNVVTAAPAELADALLLCDVEQTTTLLNNLKSAKGSFARSRAWEEVQNAQQKLMRNSGNDSGVEQQRGEVLSKLSVINESLGTEQQTDQTNGLVITGNGFLYEQELGQNRLNYRNNADFFDYNMPSGVAFGNALQAGRKNLNTDESFRFGITAQGQEEFKRMEAETRAGLKAADEKAQEEKLGSDQLERESKSKALKKENGRAAGDDGGRERFEQDNKASRSQLMQRRGGELILGAQVITPEGPRSGIDINNQPASPVPQQTTNESQQQQLGEVPIIDRFNRGRTTTSTGLLSLKFDIPTDGRRMDFLRVGGNPALSLDVRSSDAVSKGTGLVWLVLCVISILLLLGPGRRGQTRIFCQRLFLIAAVTGLAAWLLTTGDLKSWGLICCICGSLAFAVTTAVASLMIPRNAA